MRPLADAAEHDRFFDAPFAPVIVVGPLKRGEPINQSDEILARVLSLARQPRQRLDQAGAHVTCEIDA